jgi:hypothetical protein
MHTCIVFTSNVSFSDSPFLAFNSRSDILALSLRLHGGVNYCYASGEQVKQPEFLEDDTWFWTEGTTTTNYTNQNKEQQEMGRLRGRNFYDGCFRGGQILLNVERLRCRGRYFA